MLADELYALRSAQVLPSPPTFAGKSVEQITRDAIVGKSRGEAVRVGVDLAKRVIQWRHLPQNEMGGQMPACRNASG